jgi:hypothetical protein
LPTNAECRVRTSPILTKKPPLVGNSTRGVEV